MDVNGQRLALRARVHKFRRPIALRALGASLIEPAVLVRFFIEKENHPVWGGFFLVDVNGLEPLTLRTSSECSTS